MVVLIDCHTESAAHEIDPHEWLALIAIAGPGKQPELRHGWRWLLELQMDEHDSSRAEVGLTKAQGETIAKFYVELSDDPLPRALIVRCGENRRCSAGVAKALGEASGLYVPLPDIEYDAASYQLVAAELRNRIRAVRRNGVLNRIKTILGSTT